MDNFSGLTGLKRKETMGILSALSAAVHIREDGLLLFFTILAGRLFCQENISRCVDSIPA